MKSISITEILSFLKERNIDFSFQGCCSDRVIGFSSLNHYKNGTITWVKNPASFGEKKENLPMQLVITEQNSGLNPKNIIEADNSKEIFFSVLRQFWGEVEEREIAGDSVILTKSIGKNVSIGHHCFVGKDVVIEDNVQIGNNVQIECPCHIGDNSTIASGVVIGTDGFGYFQDNQGQYQKVPHFGGVWIGSKVEIGANTCIDRGTIDDTCIGDNVKIDNLCHIAHNVQIGENSLVIALSMIGGSATLEKDVYIAPGCLIKNQIEIEKDAFVGMGTVVLCNVPQNKVVVGVPAKILRDNKRKEI